MRFDELYLSDDILDAIDAMHFTECTPIQEKAIPAITDGNDLIAIAQTGTGKTAAYLLPVIDEIANGNYPRDAINCVVMAPTRELAQQIDQQLQGFAYYMDICGVSIYGGTDGVTFEQQRKSLKLGADVVIATPGRLLAHMQMGYVDLSRVSFFVLDEADRMLDMGFFDDIMQIVKQLPENRQTLLFSATMPPKIKQLAKQILNNPAEVKIAVSKPAEKIHQFALYCDETAKLNTLCEIIKTEPDAARVLIFASSKIMVKQLAKALRDMRLKAGEMHSDLDQKQRDDIMLRFKAGQVNILVATDIVARGIDIDDITMVVNFDIPHDSEDYVHRIGRTARAGEEGSAITFVSPRDRRKFKAIEKFIGKTVESHPLSQKTSSAAPPADTGETRKKRKRRRPANKKERPGGSETPQSERGDSPADKPKKRRRRKPKQPASAQQAAPVVEVTPIPDAQQKPNVKRRRRRKKTPEGQVSSPDSAETR